RDLQVQRRVALPAVAGESTAGKVTMAVAPNDGSVWIHRDGSPKVTRVTFDEAGRPRASLVTLAGANRPTGLSVNDHGLLYVSDGNDTITANLVDPPEPDRPADNGIPPGIRIAVVGEAGDDTFNTLIGSATTLTPPATAHGRIDMRLDGGPGNDTFLNTLRNIN